MFRIALALHCTVREVEQRLTWREMQEWEIYLESRPPEGEIIDWQFATLMTVIAAALGKRTKIDTWSVIERMRPKSAIEVSAEIKRNWGIEDH